MTPVERSGRWRYVELAAIITTTDGPPDQETWVDLYRRYDTTFFEAD